MIRQSPAGFLPLSIGFLLITGASLSMATTPQRWDYREARLDNGLRILTMEDHRAPLANVQIWYHVGSKDEDPQRQGFAHMFEHMMFRGTDRIGPQDHFKYLQRYGAKVNGYTSFDMTVYWETLPAAQLDRAMWLEAERLGHLKINADYFSAEREVVKEERRMGLNRPYGRMEETLYDAAFKVHPYRWTPIGNMVHLDASTDDDLRAFFKRYYVPNNATLVVVGDVRHEEVVAKAREYFGPIARAAEPPRVTVQEPPRPEPNRVEMTDIAPLPMAVLAYRTPPAASADALALEMLRRVMSGGQSSRLYRHLVLGKELAVSASGDDSTMEQGGLFTVSAVLKQGVTAEAGEAALLEEVKSLLAEGVSAEELRKARNQSVAEYVRAAGTVQGRADRLGYAAVILGDPERVNTDLDRKRSMTADQLMAAARNVLRTENLTTLVVRPGGKPLQAEAAKDQHRKAEAVPDLPPPEQMPSGRAVKPTDMVAPAIRTLPNGLEVAVFQDSAVPAITMAFRMKVGAKNDPPEQSGLAYVTTSTLRRGTREHSGDELAELIDREGMSLSEDVTDDDTTVQLWTLSEGSDLAMKTLAEVVREPVFPDKEVSGFTARAASREAVNEKTPSVMATRALDRALFGDHYLARPSTGTSKTLKAITPAAAVEFHKRYYAPDRAMLTFAGDITPADAFELAERYFGDWKGEAQNDVAPPPVAPLGRRILMADQPGAMQSEIRIGEIVSLSRQDADYAAARMVSQIFGEAFSARLMRSLRIEKGLTYGASGYFDVMPTAAALRIRTFTRTEKTVEAVKAALAEVERIRAGTITKEELEFARDTLIGQFQMGLETPAQLANRYWDLAVWNLPMNWYGYYLGAIAGTTDPAALDAAAKRVIDPGQLLIVVTGDAGKVQPELGAIMPVESSPSE
jgi:zinc protease